MKKIDYKPKANYRTVHCKNCGDFQDVAFLGSRPLQRHMESLANKRWLININNLMASVCPECNLL